MQVVSKSIEDILTRLVELDFPGQLGLSASDYRDCFPLTLEQPANYRDVFPLLVAIDPRVPLGFQMETAGIQSYLQPSEIRDLLRLADRPYFAWLHDGSRFANSTIGTAQESFLNIEAGCTLLEVVSLFIHYRNIFENRGIDSTATIYRTDYFPSLLLLNGRPELASHWIRDETPNFFPISRGKDIFVKA